MGGFGDGLMEGFLPGQLEREFHPNPLKGLRRWIESKGISFINLSENLKGLYGFVRMW